MSQIDNIKRILWHEIGHFCLDIFKVENHKKYHIDKLEVRFTNYVDDLFKWSGCVVLLPVIPFTEIPKDNTLTSHSLITVVSGCIFETIFLTQILNEKTITLAECFSFKKESLGNGDFRNYHEILSKMRDLYPDFRGKKEVFDFMEKEFVDAIIAKFKGLTAFLQSLDKLISAESIKIERDFKKIRGSGSFEYIYKGQELNVLQEEVSRIMVKYDFNKSLEELNDFFSKKYDSFKTKHVQ